MPAPRDAPAETGVKRSLHIRREGSPQARHGRDRLLAYRASHPLRGVQSRAHRLSILPCPYTPNWIRCRPVINCPDGRYQGWPQHNYSLLRGLIPPDECGQKEVRNRLMFRTSLKAPGVNQWSASACPASCWSECHIFARVLRILAMDFIFIPYLVG
jgi:hypothetical protein